MQQHLRLQQQWAINLRRQPVRFLINIRRQAGPHAVWRVAVADSTER
jgi:hypothetical protein